MRGFVLAALLLLGGCATVLHEADRLAQSGQAEQAYALLDRSLKETPGDTALRAAWLRQRELLVARLAQQVEIARVAGRLTEARATLARLQAIDSGHPRTEAALAELDRAERHERWLAQANAALAAGRDAEADQLIRRLVSEAPGHPGARAAQLKLRDRRKTVEPAPALGPAFQKPVTVEFRDAPLRAVLDGLSRTHGINFVFDKDVRADMRVTVMLRDVSLDEALRVLLTTQQLERKLLNDSTVLIYPATTAKQREHQDLVTRSFYLVNADAKQAQALVRTMAKTRDLFVDDRLNLLVVRDTAEVVAMIERLLAGLDMPEPEVVLEVEVIELTNQRDDTAGIQWPDEIRWGIPSAAGTIAELTRDDRDRLRVTIANPALVAKLQEKVTRGNVLANPRLRARNREKAKVLIGDKLPVFLSTAGTATVAGTTTVSYLDVGLKLEVESNVQLDNDVVMKVNLEVSTLTARVAGTNGSLGYQVGTRQATTTLRLRDGETQILAGLIKAEDTKDVTGLPMLADLPLAGRLFGVHTDRRLKSEVILLITPRVVRNIGLPEADVLTIPSGVDANPGVAPLRLQSRARVSLPAGRGGGVAAPDEAAAAAAAPEAGALLLATSGQAEPGGTASVSLQNRTPAALSGEIEFDPRLFQPAQGGEKGASRIAFTLPPGGEQVFVLRVLEAAAGQTASVAIVSLSSQGESSGASVPVQGDSRIVVGARK